jgi:hypothetical protein
MILVGGGQGSGRYCVSLAGGEGGSLAGRWWWYVGRGKVGTQEGRGIPPGGIAGWPLGGGAGLFQAEATGLAGDLEGVELAGGRVGRPEVRRPSEVRAVGRWEMNVVGIFIFVGSDFSSGFSTSHRPHIDRIYGCIEYYSAINCRIVSHP